MLCSLNSYEDMAVDASNRYNFSEYPVTHPLYSGSNCKALEFLKMNLIQYRWKSLYVCVQSVMLLCVKVDKNVLKHVDLVEKKTAKGVKRKVKDDHLRFGHYLHLRSFESYVCKQNLASTSAHTVRTVHSRKVGL